MIIYESFLKEADEDDKGIVQIFYSDLSLEAKQKIMEGIDAELEYADVFGDEIVKDKIETSLSARPILVIQIKDIINKMEIDI